MTELSLPLNIPDLEIISQAINKKGEIIISVKSSKTETVCHKCGKPATIRHGTARELTIRHLPIFDTPVYLVIRPIRYKCSSCSGTTTEEYSWIKKGSHITNGLSDYLMRQLIHSTVEDVAKKESIGYTQLTGAINNAINKQVDWQLYSSLKIIGIDEFALKKGYNDYITVVSTKSEPSGQVSVIGVISGRFKEDVVKFLTSIPEELKQTVESVCTDMYDGYVNAVTEVFSDRVLVVDRYHVAKKYREPLDTLRISEMKRLKKELSKEEYNQLEGMMWILRKNHECLSEIDKDKLELLFKYFPKLKFAHSFALKLTQIFNTHCNRKSGLAKIDRWIKSVKKSEVTCFYRFIETLGKYKTYIANYFKKRRSSGFVEGLNNLIKVAKRRCYGIFKTETLFQLLFLDLKGFEIYA